MHFKAAMIRAAFVVRTDARMIGLPKVREPVIEAAALRAIGIDEATIEARHYNKLYKDSQDVVFEVFERAISEAREEISALPPIRFA
jgi:hypothetical protein